jgi:hypothetical protein
MFYVISFFFISGWPHGRDGQSDSSNSGSGLYPVMMHQNPSSFSSTPVFPGFPSMAGPPTSSHPGLSQPIPGTSTSFSGMPGSSGPIDPAGGFHIFVVLFLYHAGGKRRRVAHFRNNTNRLF